MTQQERVLAVLKEGPSTSTEIAAETGLSVKHCSAYLIALEQRGIIRRTAKVRPEPCVTCGHRSQAANLYTLVAAGAAR